MSSSESDMEQPTDAENATSGQYNFKIGQKVFCFHGPMMYDARCVDRRFDVRSNRNMYLIHYHGWNKNWDEWVDESRIQEYNSANIKISNQLKTKQKVDKKTGANLKGTKRRSGALTPNEADTPTGEPRARATGGKEGSATKITAAVAPLREDKDKDGTSVEKTPSRAKNRRRNIRQLDQSKIAKQNTLEIIIPHELKEILVNDSEMVGNELLIPQLPPKITIDQMFNKYIQWKMEEKRKEVKDEKNKYKDNEREEEGEGQAVDLNDVMFESFPPESKSDSDSDGPDNKINENDIAIHREVIKGLKDYFNNILSGELIFKIERGQYSRIVEDIDRLNPPKKDDSDDDEVKLKVSQPEPVTKYQEKFRPRKNSTAATPSNGKAPMPKVELEKLKEEESADEDASTAYRRYPRDFTHHYAPIHMLRLFTKLTPQLNLCPIEPKQTEYRLLEVFHDVLFFMKLKRRELFGHRNYVNQPIVYTRRYDYHL